jgi:hypothetical protein
MGAAGTLLVGMAGRLAAGGQRYAPIALMAVGTVGMIVASVWLASRGVLDAPVLRSRGVNLEATRGATPTVWLCAHLDSKSQPIPTLLRSAGIVIEGSGFAMTLLFCLAIALGETVHAYFWAFGAAATLLGALPVVLSMVGSDSPGALDNASGVATMIAAARQLPDDPRVGVLITDAEELGLAGARAWARRRPRRDGGATLTMLNADGIDDVGGNQVMYSGGRPRGLLDAIARASRATGVRAHVGRLVPGILTDSVAFASEGMRSVTFSRGTWRSLGRVHSRRDDIEHLRGTGIADVATLISATVRDVLAQDNGPWKRSSSA